MEVDEERIRLEKLAEELVSCDDDGKQSVMWWVLYSFQVYQVWTNNCKGLSLM
jgi:hypothetical protein